MNEIEGFRFPPRENMHEFRFPTTRTINTERTIKNGTTQKIRINKTRPFKNKFKEEKHKLVISSYSSSSSLNDISIECLNYDIKEISSSSLYSVPSEHGGEKDSNVCTNKKSERKAHEKDVENQVINNNDNKKLKLGGMRKGKSMKEATTFF